MHNSASIIRGTVTAEQLLELNAQREGSYELVSGHLVVREPAGMAHGNVHGHLFARLYAHVREHRLGKVFGADVGYILSRNPDTVRAPDVSFVQAARLPAVLPTGFFPGAPDLAVEVWSPNDRFPVVEQKVWRYLDAGTREVWMIHPEHRTVTRRRPDGSAERLEVGAVLTGGDVVPGFSCRVAELFEE
ncbi:MAG TPA: Uma2 family endonuclease [Gemmatimonadaceae bacterium]|jgi:Uma2 family endonuclease|nr:Uma2 family endonuclease [Gemmatimonadaceae bacterium]